MVGELIRQRGVSELLHFTTNHGCLGALFTRHIKSRQRLEGDELVEHLFKPNARFRKDVAHLDYVNFSIDHINSSFYEVSAQKWHRSEDIFWIVFSLDVSLMTHENVLFATTNNMYTSVSRAGGRHGFSAIYADVIERWPGSRVRRGPSVPDAWPTCEQAEVLYPGEVSTQFLRRIYTRSIDEQSEVAGFLKATFHDDVEVVVDPSKFEGRPR